MFATTLDTIQSVPSKRAAYTRGILVLLALGVMVKTAWFARLGGWHDRDLVDFDAFHIVAQHVWRGDVAQAYDFMKFLDMQRAASGGIDSFMPWTYPPQFSLWLAPLGLLPLSLAYLLFTATTLAGFLAVLRAVAGSQFVLCLIVLFPTIGITLGCGQNGFLTGALIGLVCLSIDRRPMLAGAALGLMIIKPHLAIAFALYALLTRRWTVVATAGAVVVGSSALCTAIFGVEIWTALLQSIHDSAVFLEQGFYPLFRMVSVYAGLRTSGLPAGAAFAGQIVIALAALGVVVFAVYRQMPTRIALGLTAIVSLCISPYAYDYDLPIIGIGFALLLPMLRDNASETERSVLYGLPMLVGAYGTLQAVRLGSSLATVSYLDLWSIGGIAVVVFIALIVVVLRRMQNTIAQSGWNYPLSASG